jgi:hypothetical protein
VDGRDKPGHDEFGALFDSTVKQQCIPAYNDEGKQQHSRGTKCPSDASSVTPENRGCRECRCSIAPAALRANEESTQASHHRYAETIRHSLRDGVSAAS